ncbi:MAG: TIGR02921 family PEP-CTERM protein [Cyanobacteria bacterium P01_D01_bin.115]
MNPLLLLSQTLQTSWQQVCSVPRQRWWRFLLSFSCHSIFWTWNGLFLMVVYLGFMPFIGVPLIGALVTGQVPFPFVVPLLAFLAVPPVCTGVGLVKLRKHPTSLMRLFYGVEAPMMALSILRMFILRELTPASTLIVVAGAIAIATMALELVFGYAAYSKGLARFQMVAHTVVLTVGAYAGSLLLFYTVPLLWALLGDFLRLEWLGALWQQIQWSWQAHDPQGPIELMEFLLAGAFASVMVLSLFALAGFSATLFVGLPYALVFTFTQSWQRIRHAFGQQFGAWQAWAITGSVIVGLGTLFVLTSPQPQVRTLALLEQPPASITARQALTQQSPQIRAGLLNAYLQRYRYLSTWQGANRLANWYPNVLPLTRDQAQGLQNWHNTLMSPFLYRGDRDDVETAAQLYADFFDTPIQKAEAEAIKHALESTVQRDGIAAGLLNITDRVVALARQEVTVKPAGDWAEVTLYERYENFTTDAQEIVYQFSLPESAAINGIWLGEADLATRYPFVVSPRGAAQQVYKQEIERAEQLSIAEDPALLEQVGPRQYRLRVFPIPQRVSWGNPGITHLWMTYQVPQQEGGWPLPQLTEKRNLYWTPKTERRRLGQKLKDADDVWYEPAIPAQVVTAPQAHQAALAEGYQVSAMPIADQPAAPLKNQRLAVLIDTSRSMGDRTAELTQALTQMTAIAADNTVDWFITSEIGMPAQQLSQSPKVADLSFYGSLSLTEQLQQLDSLRQGAEYAAILVLTDAGNYELEADQATMPSLPGSLWLVHLGGDVPTAYADALQQHLAGSRGGVATTLAEATNRFAVEQQTAGTVMDGYQWAIAATPSATTATTAQADGGFTALAARQAIRWLSRNRDVTQIAALDELHAIAKRTEIVTPYSSMLVLVNDRQREALKAAENDLSRFDREIETGEDTLTDPGDPLNVSVPENGTPLAILFIGVILGGIVLRSHRQRASLLK